MRTRVFRSPFAAAALISVLFLSGSAAAQTTGEALWTDIDEDALSLTGERHIVPERYRTLRLDGAGLSDALSAAPLDEGANLRASSTILSLPLPDGGFGRFRIVESPIMEPGLAARFPEILTYRGQGLDDPAATARLDQTPAGFHAMILSPRGNVYVDPYSQGDVEHYISYFTRDARRDGKAFQCGVTGHDHPVGHAHAEPAKVVSGSTLRTYRLAVAATGEYTAFHGGTVAAGQAAIVTAMNRVNGIYEREVAIRMVLVANNDQVVYTNAGTDPYSNGNGSTMLGQNQSNLDSVIGNANYDIGHVFSTGGGGIASLRVPCVTGSKARGVTGQNSPIGDPFWVDFVAHEMGHQWGGNHTFNGNSGSCSGNRNGSTAYEPGSGSTIMAYAGICNVQDLQPNSDDFFHGISLDEIVAYSVSGNGDNCAVRTATGNSPPVVEAGPSFTIPLDTPFELCGSATDPEGDPLTYGWEEFDLGPAGAPGSPSGNAPIFRAFDPTSSPCRTFPKLSDLVNNTQTIGEILPTFARTMNFRLTARDNRSGGGGVADDATTVVVSSGGGPFRVTSPDTAVTWQSGTGQTVTWSVAGTDLSPISCSSVDILLSTDGGTTYPTTLAAGVPNSGSRAITVPSSATTSARVKVQCAGNIFFDISNADFTIEAVVGAPVVNISAPAGGSTFASGDPVTFTGSADDPEEGDLSANLAWSSSLDGAIGNGASFSTTTLSVGSHVITASVTDGDSNTGSAQVAISVTPGCANLLYSTGFESDAGGWVDGASSCTTGTFLRGTPDLVSDGGVTTQPGGAATGTFAWFTQNNGGGVGVDDVDGGTCETLSPIVAVGAGNSVSVFADYYHGQRDAADDAGDGFSIELIDADTSAVLDTLVSIGDVANNAVWTSVATEVGSAPANVRLRVRATDAAAAGDLVEGGIDNIQICSSGGGGGCTSDAQCNDGLFCNGAETCNLGTGVCQAGTPVACGDGVGCTVDSCNEATDSCDNVADDGLCDNGLFCDGAELCDAVNDCQAGSVPCSAGQTCDETVDVCVDPDGCLHDVDFESGAGGWTQGADSCTTGAFITGTPDATTWQVGDGNPGQAFFTANNPGGIGTDDVDGGTCEALSPVVNAGGQAAVSVSLDYYHGQRDAADDAGDGFSIEVLNDGVVVDTLVSIGDVTSNPAWTSVSTTVANPGNLQVRVRATDAAAGGDIVEGGIDNVRICPATPPPPCSVIEDFSAGLGAWVNAASTCTTGTFVAAVPTQQTSTVVTQPGGDHTTGTGNAVFTATNTAAGTDDVDGGNCVLESPVFSIADPSDLSIWYFHGQRDAGDDAAGDFFLLELSTDGGATYSPLVSIGDVQNVAAWTEATAAIPAGSAVRLRVQVSDGAGPGDIVEGGIDDLSICPQ